ncbi:hypothetical protein GCM10020254_13900 [Streptomyces goshikiensis]
MRTSAGSAVTTDASREVVSTWGAGRQFLAGLLDQLVEPQRDGPQVRPGGLEAAAGEDVVDDVRQALGGPADARQVRARTARVCARDVDRTAHHRDRGPQLVGGVGEDALLSLQRLPGRPQAAAGQQVSRRGGQGGEQPGSDEDGGGQPAVLGHPLGRVADDHDRAAHLLRLVVVEGAGQQGSGGAPGVGCLGPYGVVAVHRGAGERGQPVLGHGGVGRSRGGEDQAQRAAGRRVQHPYAGAPRVASSS